MSTTIGEEESDSDSTGSHDSASNEGNGDASYVLEHLHKNNGDGISKVTVCSVPEKSQFIPTSTASTTESYDSLGESILEDHGPAQPKYDEENTPDPKLTEKPSTVTEQTKTMETSLVSKNSQEVSVDHHSCGDVEQASPDSRQDRYAASDSTESTADFQGPIEDYAERSETSLASTDTISSEHKDAIASKKVSDPVKVGDTTENPNTFKAAEITHQTEELKLVASHNSAPPMEQPRNDHTSEAQSVLNFKACPRTRRRCHSDYVVDSKKRAENGFSIEHPLIRFKRKSSVDDGEVFVPENKRREADSSLQAGNMMSSILKQSEFTQSGSCEMMDSNMSASLDNNMFTRSADHAFKQTVVSLDRLKLLPGGYPAEYMQQEGVHSGSIISNDLDISNSCNNASDNTQDVERSLKQEKQDNEQFHQNAETPLDSTDCWNWTFEVSSDVNKYSENADEDLHIGVGIFLKSRKKKVNPPDYTFFLAETKVDDSGSKFICTAKFPANLHDDQSFFYAFFCIVRTDDRKQKFENLIASSEPEKITLKTAEKVKNWNLIKLETKIVKKRTEDPPEKKKGKKQQNDLHPEASENQKSVSNDSVEDVLDEVLEAKHIVGNTRAKCDDIIKENCVTLNAIFGSDISTLGHDRLLIGVATSLDNFKQVHMGSVVGECGNSLWLRFRIFLNHSYSVEYKYCAVDHKNYEKERFWEAMHEGGHVNRVIYENDFRDISPVKFDGHIKFDGGNDEQKSFLERVKNAVLPKWITSKKDDLKYYEAQCLEAFEIYAVELTRCFAKNMDVNWLLNQWVCLIKTLTFTRWVRGYSRSVFETIGGQVFLDSTLRCFYALFESLEEPSVGERESFQHLIFKLSTIIFVSSNFYLLELMSPVQWDKYQKWIAFTDEKTFLNFSSKLLSFVAENDGFFDLLRERCQIILNKGSEWNLKSSNHFHVFFQWALLDGKSLFLHIPTDFVFRKELLASLKSYYISNGTRKHLLILAVLYLTGTGKQFLKEEQWKKSDILACLNVVWSSRKVLPEAFLDLLTGFTDEDSDTEIRTSFETAFVVIKSIISLARNQQYRNFKFFIYSFLHFSLDLLAVVERRLTQNFEELKNNFYTHFEKLLKEIIAKDKYTFTENEIFYWANLLRYRKGYSEQSVEFTDVVLKKLLMDLLGSIPIQDKIPTFCVQIDEIVKSLNKRGWRVECYKNINAALEEALIASILSRVNYFSSDVNFVVNIDRRPLVAEAFCKAVDDKFPDVSSMESSFDVVMKNLEHELLSMILDLMGKKNPIIEKHFGKQVNAIREAFIDVVCKIQSAEITAKQFQTLSPKRNKFTALCQKLDVFDRSTVTTSFMHIDSIHATISNRMKDVSKLIELTNKFESSEIKIDVGELEQLHKEWETYSLNKLVDLKPHSSEFSIVPEFPSAEVMEAVEMYHELMASQIFSKFAFEMMKASFQRSDANAFSYQHVLAVEMKKVHQYYLQQADAVAKGHLSLNEAKRLFRSCSNDITKSQEMEFFFLFLKKNIQNPVIAADLDHHLETRKKQLKEVDSIGKSVAFLRALRKLVDLLHINGMDNSFNQLVRLENLDSFQVCDLTEELLSCNEEFSDVDEIEIKAIEAFTDQPAFLTWIRHKMKSLQELTVVAELASLSAGEIAYDIERVKFFHDAVFGYAPFIYDLNADSNLNAVRKAYKKVFSKLSKDGKLPEKYADSARHQSWFEKALETQGSVEKSSLEKALLINKSGEYSISYKPWRGNDKVLISVEDVISLKYQEITGSSSENNEEVKERNLTLSELRDLLSRLMLIVGREKHEQAQNVDTFITTFQNIERLAAAFVVLFNSGCSFFQNWRALVRNKPGRNEPSLEIHFGGRDLKPLHGFCAETNADLSDLCSVLESIKVKWQDYVFRMRNKHPILNQFNVQQLKVISSSLAKAKRTREPVEEVAMYYMRSLNDKLIALDIQRYIDESGEENEMEVDHLDEDMDVNQRDDVSNLAKITDEACVDKRSQLLSIISGLKEEFGDNEALAKAAVQATDATGYDDALNWAIDNQSEEDLIEILAVKFDEYYDSLEIEETENDSSLMDVLDAQSVHREFSSKLEKLFDGYLLDLKENVLSDFMNLHQVGRILSRCTKEQSIDDDSKRMPGHLKPGRPHLIVCEKRKDLLPQVLSLYRFANRQRLPDYSQVLMCNSRTTIQELEVFLLRSTLDPECRVYSIAFADDFSANCADHLEKFLFETMAGNTNEYNLVVFCCDESSQVSVILEKHKSKLGCESDEDLRNYICENLQTKANDVDEYRARLVTSTQPSSGKSLHIDRLEERMSNDSHERRVLRLYDRKINFEKILDVLWDCRKIENPVILHFDVSSNVLENVDELVFKLCILGGITDDRGKLFVVRENFFVALEMLESQDKSVWGHLCAVLPTTSCLSPNQCLNNANEMLNIGNQRVAADNAIINTNEFQRPHQYLIRIDTNQDVSNYTFETGRDRAEPNMVIRTLKQWSGLRNPTWAQLCNFSRFLNEQLESCEKNFFVNAGDFPGFKNFLIRHCLVKMAQDFALPSLSISDNSPLFGLEEHQRNYEVHQIRRRWENHPHPYVFFNADMTTFTFLGVRVHNSNLLDSNGHVLAHYVMTPDLEQQIKRQAYDEPHILGEHFDNLPKKQKFTKLCRVLGVENEMKGRNVDINYELTQDNVMKLLAIHMRFRCDIPVIIMGETGCGKTRLIEYLCLLIGKGKTVQNKKIVKVHGGVTVDDIVRNVEEAEALAIENTRTFGRDFYTVLFFDEANTTEAIYAIKEVVCDFSVNGRKLDPNSGLKIIVACNPYRKHDPKMIKKLESQGLGYHVKSSETEDKLDSDIPMRHLVYRVNPLPPSLLPLVWDFGQLTSQVEDKYIKQIVARHARKFSLNDNDTQFVCDVLSISQKFLRENRDQCLFVSLRDIERALSVLGFFHSKREKLLSEMDDLDEEQMIDEDDADEAVNELARLMILTLGVCYHSSLEERPKYRDAIARAFKNDYRLPNGAKSILKELELCQQVFVRNLHLDEKANIAKNLALSENVFMMIICIQLRIPLFLVGKPGSSKSLAKTIVIDAMQGGSSRNDFFKLLKQVQMLSFQCSPHTNAEGIVSTFKQAALYQKGKDLESFVSVVVLDEIGLAEDSPKMPLKTLHPLLEEGYVEDGQRNDFGKVGFVGISNWALDPAKMNRGILVSRAVPKSKELIKSARGICRVEKEGKPLEKFIQPLSDAYEEIYRTQIKKGNPEYFGLRDFYGLLKMLHREFIRNNRESPSWSSVQRAIRRNFGEKNDGALQVFVKHLKKDVFETRRADSSKTSTLNLVEDNMKEADKRAELPEDQRSMDNESRYLLLMTENFSALQLLPQVLNLKNCEIIFGSSFPQDQEYIQVCKNINRIKVCMEMGTTVVLLNLGSLYESLYDALNQYYVYYGGRRYVDLGLGSNRVKCSVSEKFRLIMIEEEKVALKFPIPLLNRLEKHFLGMESILGPNLKHVREKICENLENFANVPRQDSNGASFTIRDAFVGYQEDTTACVVMQAKTQLERQEMSDEANLYDISLDNIFQTCTKEAMIRAIPEQVEVDIDHVKYLYERQGRKNLSSFLWKQFYSSDPVVARHLVEVTTFCRIPSHNDIKSVNKELMENEGSLVTDDRHAVINLNVFETEHEFVERVKDFVRRSRKYKMKKILFVTCAKGDRFVSLIACVKYSLQNLFLEINDANLFILFLVQLPRYWYRSNYSSFSVGQWTSFHVDKLLVEEEIESMMEVTECQGSTLKDLFVLQSGECSKFQRKLLRDVVYEAVADSRSPGPDKLQRVSNVFRLFQEHHDPSLEVIFLNKAATFMDNECGHDEELKKWMAEKASNLHELIQNGDLEHALFHELKQRVKPHLAEFLQTIDFNNNVRLLFGNNWCKRLWMELFSLKEISRARILNRRENTFDSLFPFSAEINAKMELMWVEALEHGHDQNMEPKDYFIYSYENQEDELWNILREVSLDESGVDAFLHDLICHEFAGTTSCIKKEQNKFIRKSISMRMSTKPNSLALAFALFTNLKPEIAAVAPVLRSFSCKILVPIEIAFKTFVVQTALDSLSNEANDLELTKSDIGKFVQNVQIVKMSSEDLREDPDFNLKLQKLSIFSTFLREVCHGLDEEMTQQAASGAKTIWTSVRAGENMFGTKKLVNRLSFCLKKSLDNVLKVCLMREFGRHDCALCRKDVVGKGLVPFVIPCQRHHVVHQTCWDDKMKALRNQEGNTVRDGEFKCLLCNEELNIEVLVDAVANEYACSERIAPGLWKQFSENICKVFINLVKDHFVENCAEDAATDILRLCLFFNEDSQQKLTPYYITSQSKQALVTIFAQNNPDLLNAVFGKLINDDITTSAFQINCSKTLDLLLAVFECVFSNDGFPHHVKNLPEFIMELQRIVTLKVELSNFCDYIVDVLNHSRRADFTIPRSIREFLNRGSPDAVAHLKNLFIRTMCLDHGMNFYAEVKKMPALHNLMPQELLDTQGEDFTDIFLVVPEYPNTLTEFVKGVAANPANAIAVLGGKQPLMKNLIVYRYLLDSLGRDVVPQGLQVLLEALQNRSLPGLDNIVNPDNRVSPYNHRSQNLEQPFLFLLQTVFSTQQNVGILDPLKNIALNRINEANLYLPTFPDSVQRNMGIINNAVQDFTTWNTCPNGHQYLIGDCGQPNAPGVCPDCGAAIGGGGQHRFNPNNRQLGNRGTVPGNFNAGQVTGYQDAASNSRNFERKVTSFTGNVMRAFLHAALFLKSADNNNMVTKLRQNVDIISRSALNVSHDNVWKFLVDLLVTAPNQQLLGSFQSEDAREQWEDAFSAHVVAARGNLNTILQRYDDAFKEDCRNDFNRLPAVLYGTPFDQLPSPRRFDEDLVRFEKFWARSPKVALATFEAQVNADKDRHPLLSALLEHEVVESLKNIPTFLHVFKEIMKHFNIDESHKMLSIKNFLEDLPSSIRETITNGVRLYIKTWNELMRYKLDAYPTIKCLFKDRLSMDAPIRYFLPTRHFSDCCALVTMNFLISKNNELVEKYRGVCNIETPVIYLEEGNVGEENVVLVSDLKRDLLSVVVTFTTQDLSSNTPRVVHDFGAIERTVGARLCAFKPLIRMKIMPLMSKSSSTKSALNNARPLLKEMPLSKIEAEKISRIFTEIPEVCKVLRQLVLLMKYLEKDYSKEKENLTIADFMKNKLKLDCSPAIGNYDLNQTVALWQHLSLKKTYLMIDHTGEDPYPDILDEFKQQLDVQLKQKLGKMNKDRRKKLLIMLNEFIVLNLNEPDLMKPEFHIEADCLDIYFDEETKLKLPDWMQLKYAEDVIKVLIETGSH